MNLLRGGLLLERASITRDKPVAPLPCKDTPALSRRLILPSFAGLALGSAMAFMAHPAGAQAGTSNTSPICQASLDSLQGAMTREMFEQAATEMVEAGAPRVLASQPSREAVGAGWVLLVIDRIAAAQADCRLDPDALDRFGEREVRDSVKTAAATDRATCRAILQRIHDGATDSYTRRSMGWASSLRGAAQLRRTLFEDIWPMCPDSASEELVNDARTATSKDLSTARETAQ